MTNIGPVDPSSPDVVKLDYPDDELYIHAASRLERESRAFSCRKEPGTVEWMQANIKAGEVVLDVGANVGAYALIMSRLVGDSGRVFAFEPSWVNFHQLNRNILLNRCESVVAALHLALADEESVRPFNFRDYEAGSSLHTFDQPIDMMGESFQPYAQQWLMSMTIDHFVERFGIGDVHHMKLDVDGLEASIIRGGAGTMQSDAFRSVMVELNDELEQDQQCLRDLKSWGFAVEAKHANPSVAMPSSSVFNYTLVKA